MRLLLRTKTADDYQEFLRIRRLPRYWFNGDYVEIPDEYAHLITGIKSRKVESDYEPSSFLFDYQAGISKIANTKNKFAIFADPGLGKTLMFYEFARHSVAMGLKTLIVSPLMVVPQTISEGVAFYGDGPEQVAAADLQAWLNDPSKLFGITNYEAIRDGLTPGKLGSLILDECFAAGTPIDIVTPGGVKAVPIERVKVGDQILNASGVDEVSDVHRREVSFAVAVECGETRIVASPNHPFFTQRGWIGAQDLRPGDSVLRTSEAVRMVRSDVHSGEVGVREVLQSVLLSEMADEPSRAQGEGSHQGDAREGRQVSSEVASIWLANSNQGTRSHRRLESDVSPGSEGESLPPIESDEASTFRAWGQRDWFDGASEDSAGCTWTDLGGGVLFVTGPADCGLPHSLQARLGEQRTANRDRGGWSYSLLPESERPKEGCETGFVRVDGIEILEPGHPELEGLRDADGKLYFYDLGGTRHPSFSISGLLVHNSSLLKSAYGKWGMRLIELGKGLPRKLCATGTPAPNDRIEYANHAVFLDVHRTVNEFYAKYFVNKGQSQNRWELKPHALSHFYRDMSHWCIFLSDPSVYGWKDNVGTLPPIHIHIEHVDLTPEQRKAVQKLTGGLVVGSNIGGIGQRSKLSQIAKGVIKREPAGNKSDRKPMTPDGEYVQWQESIPTNKPGHIKRLVESWPDESTILWCRFNDEQDSIARLFPDAANIDGKTKYEDRVRLIDDFKAGRRKQLVSKPEILGFGLNLQIATRQVFSSCEDSYEDFYQCVKRSNRVKSTKPLNVHLPVTEIEEPMMRNVLAKAQRVEQDAKEQERLFREVGYVGV